MAASYRQFLAAPNTSLLADAASLHYVTTTTTVVGSTQIIQHLNTIGRQIEKKKEDVLNLVDGGDAAVLEVDTGLQFQTSGGPYLPGLDDNLLAARTAFLPITHIVNFDKEGKIVQIRLQWDQGSLLKQVNVIGKSGRNWPIRDSSEQIALIQKCLKLAGTGAPMESNHNDLLVRTRTNSTNAMRDPHASLQLFGSREELESPIDSVVSPYAGARPRQRSFTEILGDEPTPGSPTPTRSMSPAKTGGGKNFRASRIFDGQPELPADFDSPKPNKFIRPNPKKYSHFDFADGTDPEDAPKPGVAFDEKPKTKHDSQWSFADFTTPEKPKFGKTMATRLKESRHWDTDKDALGETPTKPAVKPHDAEAHFELEDDDQVLSNITNLQGRGENFDPHSEIHDGSKTPHTPEPRKKAVNMNWSDYDQPSQKENRAVDAIPAQAGGQFQDHRINIAGDGMGGRKGTNRDWLYGEATDLPQNVPGRKQGVTSQTSSQAQDHRSVDAIPAQAGGQFQDHRINIAGDGMGGKKGTNRDWLYGEATDLPDNVPGRKQGATSQSSSQDNRSVDAIPAQAGGQFQDHRINIAGDGMGGKKGTNRDWLYGEVTDLPQNVPGRKPGNSPEETGPKQHRINIAGDGMGGKKGTDRDWLYGESEEVSKPVPGRVPGAVPAQTGGKAEDHRITIAGDGMGGRKGTNRDWLYGEVDNTAQNQNQNQKPKPAAEKGFWDF